MLYLVLLQIGVAFQFLLMGVPILAFTFLLVYSGAISIIYIFVLQLVYLNRHKFLRFHNFYFFSFFLTFICVLFLFMHCANFFTFDNLYLNNMLLFSSSNFFTKFGVLFYNSDHIFLPILSFSIFIGLKVSLILGDSDVSHIVSHQSTQCDRNSSIVFSIV
jgi:NADH:ubiquinone oxidoreductase subunit 6 (subunit J)